MIDLFITKVLSYLFILFFSTGAFPSYPASETVGGLIVDGTVLSDRQRIEEEAILQSDAPVISSNWSSFSISCPRDELEFRQKDNELLNISCNLTYWNLSTPIAISFETDVQDIAKLSPAFWFYLSPLDENTVLSISLNISIQTFRMGSTFLKAWIREAKPGGFPESLHVFDRENVTQVLEYYDWIANSSSKMNDSSVMGFQVRVLRPRGALEFGFRIAIICLVCGITFLMGCELDGWKIWMHLKKPTGPIIGFLCQFGLMPLVSCFN